MTSLTFWTKKKWNWNQNCTHFPFEYIYSFIFCLNWFNETFKCFEHCIPRASQIELRIYFVDFMQAQKKSRIENISRIAYSIQLEFILYFFNGLFKAFKLFNIVNLQITHGFKCANRMFKYITHTTSCFNYIQHFH